MPKRLRESRTLGNGLGGFVSCVVQTRAETVAPFGSASRGELLFTRPVAKLGRKILPDPNVVRRECIHDSEHAGMNPTDL